MRTLEHAAKPTATTGVGRSATLRAVLRARGSGASRIGRWPLWLSVLAVVLCALASMAPSALAAVETPEVTVEDSTSAVSTPSVEVRLRGVLNPHAAGEAGTYQFLYNASKTGVCTGGSVAPASPGMSFGFESETYYETISGLTAGTEYAVCLRAENAARTQSKTSAAVSFKAPVPPQTPVTSEPAKAVTATTAELEGTLNPLKAGEAGMYEFLYRVSPTECQGERSSPSNPAGVMSGAANQAVSVSVSALQPNATYTFCLLAGNAAGETVVGNPVHFTTPVAPPSILGESASHHNSQGAPLGGGEARLEGVVNPNNQLSECHFQYGEASVSEHEVPCEPELLKGYGEDDVAADVSGLTGVPYHFRILAKNGKGEVTTGSEKTVLPPEAPAAPTAPQAAVTGIATTAATLHGVLDPHSNHEAEPGVYEFVYRQSASECQRTNSQSGQPEDEFATPASPATGAEAQAVQGALSELLPGTTYTFCLLIRNYAGEEALGSPETFTTIAVGPTIESESVENVTAESASVRAQIDPGGADTTYRFEYGESEAYGQSTPESASIGAGDSGLSVSAQLQGLRPATTYHYRVLATNAKGSEEGKDHAFTTQGSSTEFTLPDGREWEMVSPPNKQGAQIDPLGWLGGDDIQAAQNGDAFTYGLAAPIEANPAGNRALELAQAFSVRREGPDGPVWETADITTPNEAEPGEINTIKTDEYDLFSSDLSLGFLQPPRFDPLPPLPSGSERTVYLRNDATGEYEALVTAANTPFGTKFGGEREENESGIHLAGATSDLSHVLLNSEVALTPERVRNGLYEWTDGKLQLVSVLPNEEASEGLLGGRDPDSRIVRHAISDDGSRIVWEKYESSGESLFMRVVSDRPETIELAEDVQFQTASNDESRVFFSTGKEGTGDLDVFEVSSGEGEPVAGRTTMLTETGEVRGVIGAGEDGSYVYFVDSAALGDGAAHGAEEGGNNLYVDHFNGRSKAWEAPTFITSEASTATWASQPEKMAARISPDGRYLTFMSAQSLTGYDNHDANSGLPDEEVYLYRAPEDPSSEAGSLACVSCNPTGARPTGVFDTYEGGGLLTDYGGIWEHEWLAANVPTWELVNGVGFEPPQYQPRYLSDSGRLFFDSSDALVPADVNGKVDVYEYEPAGVGSCQPPGYGQSASVEFVAKDDGCVGLISAGTSSEESVFMDASESGEDVFFLTSEKLAPQDADTNFDVYDAHECTSSSPCPPAAALTPPPCSTGDGCKPAPTPQPTLFGSPASATFTGAGNPSPPQQPVAVVKSKSKPAKCRKGLRRNAKGRCVKRRKTRLKRSTKGRK